MPDHLLPTADPVVHLPPATATVRRRVLDLLESDGPLDGRLGQLIEVDAVLTGMVLRAVRCPLYGLEETANSSIGRALEQIGRGTLRHMAKALPVRDGSQFREGVELACRQWVHAVAVATAARWLSNTGAFEHPQQAYMAGLLHDVGRLLNASEDDPSEASRRTSHVLRRWHLPTHVHAAARFHRAVRQGIPPESLAIHGQPLPENTRRLLDVLARADVLAAGLGYDDGNFVPALKASDPDAPSVREAIELELTHAAGLLGLELDEASDFLRVMTNAELRLCESGKKDETVVIEVLRTAARVASVHRALVSARAVGTVPEILAKGLHEIREGLGFDRVVLLEKVPGEDDQLRARLAQDPSGIQSEIRPAALVLPYDEGGALWDVLDGGEPRLACDEETDRAALDVLGVPAFAAAPLFAGSAFFGVVVADQFFSGRGLGASDASILGLLCDTLGLVLENAALDMEGRTMRSLAEKDELTGIDNRRNIVMALQREISRAHRFDSPLSVALIDVDHFKSWNDTHGHQVGDTVLKAVAQLIASCSREVDAFGRYGGEEFLVVLPETPVQHAVLYAERLRVTLATQAAEMFERFQGTSLTVSIGVSTLQSNDDVDGMVRRADLALYAAKKHGRDRVCVEMMPEPAPLPQS